MTFFSFAIYLVQLQDELRPLLGTCRTTFPRCFRLWNFDSRFDHTPGCGLASRLADQRLPGLIPRIRLQPIGVPNLRSGYRNGPPRIVTNRHRFGQPHGDWRRLSKVVASEASTRRRPRGSILPKCHVHLLSRNCGHGIQPVPYRFPRTRLTLGGPANQRV